MSSGSRDLWIVADPIRLILGAREVGLGAVVLLGGAEPRAEGVEGSCRPGAVGQHIVPPQALAEHWNRGVGPRAPQGRAASSQDAVRSGCGPPVGWRERPVPSDVSHEE